MKKAVFTYDVVEIENGEKITGETCTEIKLSDFAANNLETYGERGVAYREVEKALATLEDLMGRDYIQGSIKSHEYK